MRAREGVFVFVFAVVVAVVCTVPGAAGEQYAKAVTLSPHRFTQLNRYTTPFGFLEGGTARVDVVYSPEWVDLRFLFCTDTQISHINAEYGSVSALCEAGDDVPCAVNTRIANGSYTLDMEMRSKGVYYALLGNCAVAPVSVNYAYLFLNPGGQHLSYGDIPIPVVYRSLTGVWLVGTLLWLANKVAHYATPIKLHSVVGAAAVAKAAAAFAAVLYWEHLSETGAESSDTTAMYLGGLVVSRTVLFGLVLLFAKGYCITVARLPADEVKPFAVTLAIVGGTTFFDAYYHGYYLFIVVIVYVMVLRVLFTALAESVRDVRGQLGMIRRGNIDPRTTPVQRKLNMLQSLQTTLIYFLVALVMLSIANVFVLSHYRWVYTALFEALEVVLVARVGWTLRLRDFAPYEVTPVAAGEPELEPEAGLFVEDAGEPPVGLPSTFMRATLTRSAMPAPIPQSGPLRSWTPGMALPNTPQYAAQPSYGGPELAVVVFPAYLESLKAGGSGDGAVEACGDVEAGSDVEACSDDETDTPAPFVASHIAIGTKVD